MLECLRFLLQQTINFVKVLFTVDVGFTSLGVVFCIVFILFPMILAIVMFLKTSFVEEIDERYDSGSFRFPWQREYVGRHEPVGRHSKEYFKRTKSKYYRGRHGGVA